MQKPVRDAILATMTTFEVITGKQTKYHTKTSDKASTSMIVMMIYANQCMKKSQFPSKICQGNTLQEKAIQQISDFLQAG
uniref:Uncharacterized protein n=1 Tax=Arion vulgaris TaxID=1028688 RepID=A0A0B7B5U4_9EUPU